MSNKLTLRAVFTTALLFSIIFPTSLFSLAEFDVRSILQEKTALKLEEMGNELFDKTEVSTVIIAKEHLTQEEFLNIKDSYLAKLKEPYVLWIFSKTYMDKKEYGINKFFKSKDLEDALDESNLFSPFNGTFTKLLTTHSKGDMTSAAFLNGYGDLVDMLSDYYGVTIESGIGNDNRNVINIARVVFYGSLFFFIIWYIKIRFLDRRKKSE